jgi:hypothetical protein
VYRLPFFRDKSSASDKQNKQQASRGGTVGSGNRSTARLAGEPHVRPCGVENELKPVRDGIEGFKPHVAFTLLEKNQGDVIYDQNVASYLECMSTRTRRRSSTYSSLLSAGQPAYRVRQFERGRSHTAKVSAKSSSGWLCAYQSRRCWT